MFQEMKGLSPKKKVEHYIHYYGLATVIIIVVLIFVIKTVIDIASAKDNVAGIIALNNFSEDYDREESPMNFYLEGLLSDRGYDTDKEQIELEISLFIGDNVDPQMAVASQQKLQTVLMAKAVDIVFFDESYKDTMLGYGAFANMSDYLTDEMMDDILTNHAEDLLYFTDPETGDTYPVAIHIGPNSKIEEISGWYPNDNGYVGICYIRLSQDDSLYQTIVQDCLED